MDIEGRIVRALAELASTAYPWRESVEQQLRYCSAVLQGKAAPERLEELTMGYIVLRELDGAEPNELGEAVSEVQYHMQQRFLPYAAKVRLGIHRRA